ncbi:MAG: PleD family two-component system response regulator [Anaerolineae bacterium]
MTQSHKILVVDDEASIVELCQIILEDAGYQVRGAISGSQAMELITEEMPDLVLLDVMMPGMTGIEVCRQIRARCENRQPAIVMYTADDRDETRMHSLSAGANDLITKRTPIFELPDKISPYLASNC